MSPEDVPAEWVEAAGLRVYDEECCLVSARVLRLALAAVLPEAQAAAFDDFAARVRAQWAKDGERCPWVGALDDEAARLREGSPS